ncbi:hypothetical protein CA603_05520 [Paraburkholderia hospita]|nr:hypothetical protein CA603_05520 [Paraburkholderia hospita]
MTSPEGETFRWTFDGEKGAVEVDVESALTANVTDILLTAALAILAESLVDSYIKCGKLIRVSEP